MGSQPVLKLHPRGINGELLYPGAAVTPPTFFFFLWFRIRDFVGMFQERGV